MCQYCEDYEKLRNEYFFTDTFDFKNAQKFNTKYQDSFKLITNYNYAKLKKIDSEDKLYQLFLFSAILKSLLHPIIQNGIN
jgi:hypothetical protein